MTLVSDEATIDEQHQARLALVQYAKYTRPGYRDSLIRRAHRAGITPTEIANLLGMSRQRASEIANATANPHKRA